jgi:DHA1 family multidrug resistance protein-like MFS transporter
VLIGVAPLLAGLLAPVWGRLADRYGQKRMAVRALLSYVVLMALTAYVTSVGQLFVLRAGIGLFGGIGPLGLAMATSRAPREHTGRAVGSIQSAQILSAAVGPLTGGFLADTIGIRMTFLVATAACAVSLALLLAFYDEGPRPTTEGAPEVRPPFLAIFHLPHVAGLLLVLFLVNFVGRSFTPILPLHLQSLGIPAERLAFSTGILISCYSVAAAISASMLGRASRRWAPRGLLIGSLLAGAMVVWPMGRVDSFPAVLALAILLGLASGGALTLCYTIGGLVVGGAQRTTAFGFFSSAALFGGALSPSVAGLLVRWDLKAIYAVDAVIFAALAAGLWLAAPRSVSPASAEPVGGA